VGDLNYRLDFGTQQDDKEPSILQFETMVRMIDDGKLDEFVSVDQLNKERKANRVFYGFTEGELSHRPTFKVIRGVKEAQYSASRSPAWCDRILWRSVPGFPIKQKYLSSIEAITTSDHKPVVSTFSVETFHLPAANDPTRGASFISFPFLTVKDLSFDRDDKSKNVTVDPYLRFNAPFLTRPYSTQVEKKIKLLNEQITSPNYQWNDIPAIPLQYNNFERLKKSIFHVTLINHKGESVMGRGIIPLPLKEKREVIAFEFSIVLDLGGTPVGKLEGTIRLQWKDELKLPARIAGGNETLQRSIAYRKLARENEQTEEEDDK